LSAPSGFCEAGYFCGGGSTVATPFGSGFIGGFEISYSGDSCVTVVNNTMNDICPPGLFYLNFITK
jgi:hypothetical protein